MKKKILIVFLGTLGLIVVPVVLYLIAVGVGVLIPVNAGHQQADEGVPVFLSSNGVHVDLVLPVEACGHDWRSFADPADFAEGAREAPYVAFGWGDRGFYMETPSWDDLSMKTAFRALFLESPSAMHVTYYNHIPEEGEKVRKIVLTPRQYQILIDYIKQGFEKGPNGKPVILRNPGDYEGWNDNFYKAKGNYTAFYTCNNWTNGALQKIGIKTALWAPLESGVLYYR